MSQSIDTFAATNPAYCSLVLYSFVEGYLVNSNQPVDATLLFLPLPIALSEELAIHFEGTNASTGLLPWLSRNPQLAMNLPTEIRMTKSISRNALLFGISAKILVISDDGKVTSNPSMLRKQPKDPPSRSISQRPLTVARRFGNWCGNLQSTSLIFASLGIRP